MNQHVKTTDGDLLKLAKNGEFDVIIHGCNCFTAMFSGIAGQIRKEYLYYTTAIIIVVPLQRRFNWLSEDS